MIIPVINKGNVSKLTDKDLKFFQFVLNEIGYTKHAEKRGKTNVELFIMENMRPWFVEKKKGWWIEINYFGYKYTINYNRKEIEIWRCPICMSYIHIKMLKFSLYLMEKFKQYETGNLGFSFDV